MRDATHLAQLRDAVAEARELGRPRFNNSHAYVDPVADELGIKPEKVVGAALGRPDDELCKPI